MRGQALLAAEEADAVIVVVDGRAGLNPLDRHAVRTAAPLAPAAVVGGEQDRHAEAGRPGRASSTRLGIEALYPHLGRARRRGRRADGRRCWRRLPTGAGAGRRRRRAADGRGDHRPAQRRQVLAAQPPGRLRARHRQRRAGDDARRARHAGHAAAGATTCWSTPPACAAGRASSEHIERASVVRALRALERAEVALLVIDAVEGMTEQDARVAGYAWERGRALVLVVNKWDAVPADARRPRAVAAQHRSSAIRSLAVVPKLFISALQRARRRAHLGRHRRGRRGQHRVPPADREAEPGHRPRRRRAGAADGQRRARRASSTPRRPPTRRRPSPSSAAIRSASPPAYERYLINQLRAAFGLEGTPLRCASAPSRTRGAARPARRPD